MQLGAGDEHVRIDLPGPVWSITGPTRNGSRWIHWLYGRYEYPMAIHSFVIGVFTTINIIVFVDTRHKTGGELWNVRREGERH